MRKKTKSTTVEAKKDAISLIVLAKEFGVKYDELLFAIAETLDGDDVYDTVPVALLIGTDKYIDLSDGTMKKNACAKGLKQNFYDCEKTFKGEKFIFSSPQVKTEVSAKTLVKNFGAKVLTSRY